MEYGNSKITTLLPSAKCTRPLFQGRTGCGGRPSGWHDIVTCQRPVYYTLSLDLPLRKLNYVLFSSAYSLVRGFLCRKQTCTVTVLCPLDGPPSVDSINSSRHRSIPGYRPTIWLIASGRSSVHSMRRSQILGQNPDFSLPHVHSTPPLGGGSVRILL